MKQTRLFWLGIACLACQPLVARTLHTTVYSTHNPKHAIGQVSFKDTQHGLLITPHLSELSPGEHGFHIHVRPNCAQEGKAAGGHLDPLHTNKHLGPNNIHGHLGDLPTLHVEKDGHADGAVTAPRLTTYNLHGHSIMIHQGGDNYQDNPKPLGGGGARVGCGVIH